MSFSEATLSDRLITDVQYKWKTTRDFLKIGQDLRVFVHFWHKSNLLFYDNHTPEVPTSQWDAGKEYTYSRRIYIPAFIDELDPEFRGEETLKLSIGFSIPYERGKGSLRKIFERKLKVLSPPPDTPKIIYDDGWYDLEVDPRSFLKRWRWTSRKARCIIDNPHRDALMVLKGGVNQEALDDQKIIFKINDLIIDEFIPEESHFEKSYRIEKEKLGGSHEFYLIISTDKTFIPAQVILRSRDKRELGIQISFIYFR